ncbi:MAG: helix-turn-helix domain-containing protein [Bacteroidales bacterium]|nr:helix-turn-helix domain-containing protein [Bacteroidales bacterium]
MENITKIITRLSQYAEYKHINFNQISIKIGVSNSYFSKMEKNNGSFGEEILRKILLNYEEINPEWLLTGNGKMLKETYVKPVEPENKVKESSPIYNKVDYKEKYYTLLEDYHKLNEENRELREQKECGSTQSQKSKNNKSLLPV